MTTQKVVHYKLFGRKRKKGKREVYGLKHRPNEALNATPPGSQLLTAVFGLASASCKARLFATNTITNPSRDSAAIRAIITIDAFIF
jgi:hypothetical protein